MQGRIVNEMNNIVTHDQEFKISTKGILSGIYFLRITNRNNSFTIKIIKD
ncbi:MAG: T9SS type A sorting domain-containing protein [Bacteroidetes bacterium]|nr:T9SS type A sorting domain-containing protein [Bacteroidota bacterium]